MSTEGWIFMIGFRVFDVGLLVAWLIWFLRQRDDGEGGSPDDGDGGGGGNDGRDPRPRRGPGGGGLALPTGRWGAGWRRRDGHTPSLRRPRVGRPLPQPLPARVRFPGGEPERISPRR